MDASGTIQQFDTTTQKNISAWLNGPYDALTKNTIEQMLKDPSSEIVDAFYTHLSFGTGGMRGIMGVGTNRINQYTIRACTQGLANYINQDGNVEGEHRVFIGYDSRHDSKMLAEECAKVLAGNHIRVYIFKNLRPTPLVSFGCLYKKCTSAIMLTASHNPPHYNGYKVFWKDGSQVLSPHDKGIADEVNKITEIQQIKSVACTSHPLIEWVENEIDKAYLETIDSLQHYSNDNKQYGKSLKVIYTSLHGTGITLVPPALQSWGFSQMEYVNRQIVPDGDFPTCKSPNPEEKEALTLGIETLLKANGDILIATDPDADRVGVVVQHHGQAHLIDGNQMACLLLHHILEALSSLKRLPLNAAFVKTIVTSELFQEICNFFQKPCFNVLTGFKYFGEKIRDWNLSSQYQYIFGGEDSCGYLYGTIVRDKDGILSSALICEMALQAKLKGKTLIDVLHDIWKRFGTYVEKLLSIKFEDTKVGRERMSKGMNSLKETPPKVINGIKVLVFEDYFNSKRIEIKTGKTEKIALPKSDALLFILADGSKLVIRPSGTEPKIKVYCGVVIKDPNNIDNSLREGEKLAENLISEIKRVFF